MINIVLKGVDEFLGADVEKVLLPKAAKVLQVSMDEVLLTCMHSMIYHGGLDQTSFHMIVTFEMEEKYRKFEKELIKCVFEVSKNFSVHSHVNFLYLTPTSSNIDKEYPLYVTESNRVIIEDDENEEEVYTGNMFSNFEEQLKELDKNKKD